MDRLESLARVILHEMIDFILLDNTLLVAIARMILATSLLLVVLFPVIILEKIPEVIMEVLIMVHLVQVCMALLAYQTVHEVALVVITDNLLVQEVVQVVEVHQEIQWEEVRQWVETIKVNLLLDKFCTSNSTGNYLLNIMVSNNKEGTLHNNK
jgi:hypothetical protein